MPAFDEFAHLERSGWADAATVASYVRDFGQAAEICAPAIVTAAGGGTGTDALDLCCGHGILARRLVDAGLRVTGLDFSPAFLAIARKLVPEAQFIEGDAMALPFAAESFDAVVIGCGIPHVPDPRTVLAECARVLRPGGRLAFSVWHGPERFGAFSMVFGAIQQHGDPGVSMPPGPGAHDFADAERAFAALKKVGLGAPAIETVESYWDCTDPGAPYDFFLEGTVRGGAMLRTQPAAARTAIREAVAADVRQHIGPEGPWKIPVPAAIVSAVKA